MDNSVMARAIQLSIDNVVPGQGVPFGAVIVKNGEIISEGVNRVTAEKDPQRTPKSWLFVKPARNCGFSN